MPELPEVESVRTGLKPLLLYKKIIQVSVLTEKSFIGVAEAVLGAKVVDLRRKGKALLIDLDNDLTMMIHLRMTGQLIWRGKVNMVKKNEQAEQFAAGHPSKNFTDKLPNGQTRVIFEFSDGNLYFNDQRKFGFVKVLETEAVGEDKFIAQLGPEPWQMSAKKLYEVCQRHAKANIKAVLLDQKNIAGLGNIYTDEALFYANVHPATKSGDLSFGQVEKILEGACQVLEAGIRSGGSTLATYIKPDGTTGDYLTSFAQVFNRKGLPCAKCNTKIEKTRVAGRGTYYCPKCQCGSPMPGSSEWVARCSSKESQSCQPRDTPQKQALGFQKGHSEPC